ncbi:MAG: hypothetical protein M1827_003323 [Pycnora praestabilis]|nr:MAG: hypothetical protein M1827_003323 [Pycnora praestabilis]
MASDFHTGQRVSFSGVLCTVRYVGTIEGTKGEWLGVEWDDPSRGKHSGEHNGIIYFRCRSRAPTAGSFVRRSRPVDKPLSFLEALHGKYASDTHGGSDKVIKIGGKVVEEVGFDKIRKQMAMLQELRIVLLDGMCIAGVLADSRNRNLDPRTRAMDVIRDTCPKVVDLDLSRNLFERWEEVADICGAIHNVQSLKVEYIRTWGSEA